jgi:hypothetical protein
VTISRRRSADDALHRARQRSASSGQAGLGEHSRRLAPGCVPQAIKAGAENDILSPAYVSDCSMVRHTRRQKSLASAGGDLGESTF